MASGAKLPWVSKHPSGDKITIFFLLRTMDTADGKIHINHGGGRGERCSAFRVSWSLACAVVTSGAYATDIPMLLLPGHAFSAFSREVSTAF